MGVGGFEVARLGGQREAMTKGWRGTEAGGAVGTERRLWRPAAMYDPEVRRFLEPHAARSLPDLPGLTYPVRRWEHVSWIAPPTPGYQIAMEERLAALGRDGMAVLCQFSPLESEESGQLLFMLWVDESEVGTGWKLWGVEPEAVD